MLLSKKVFKSIIRLELYIWPKSGHRTLQLLVDVDLVCYSCWRLLLLVILLVLDHRPIMILGWLVNSRSHCKGRSVRLWYNAFGWVGDRFNVLWPPHLRTGVRPVDVVVRVVVRIYHYSRLSRMGAHDHACLLIPNGLQWISGRDTIAVTSIRCLEVVSLGFIWERCFDLSTSFVPGIFSFGLFLFVVSAIMPVRAEGVGCLCIGNTFIKLRLLQTTTVLL